MNGPTAVLVKAIKTLNKRSTNTIGVSHHFLLYRKKCRNSTKTFGWADFASSSNAESDSVVSEVDFLRFICRAFKFAIRTLFENSTAKTSSEAKRFVDVVEFQNLM
jgi:hypothetical protein